MGDEDFLYVDRERVRGLITAVNASADTLGTIDVDQQAAALMTAVAGTGVGTACSTGALSAAAAIESTLQKVRRMAAATDTGLSTVVAMDRHNADQMPQGN
ncbi:hypothetical protein FOH10_18960 [Nocardia otitidiscaviarum]|uniref:ESX-1 secretion-associated protein n=1 Tax=Nocardia otitidiscaviarum TaxID=1823 RepID=A0A516NNK3_9NOCA|nr:hypothetical protein [Nocardia otitidiscaviarum]MCP9624284.1 hypothetical protein [Nocardia otitidiscaviarum]QDP80483.1 hypothetical protein FOH10_18960 [Nocardia otitidiscaviarum]